ncbi:MAG TPA: xanthine dehydrogenase accessory protein XdhC [Patescibacteria group bacterium]|nr:xanthine dehydrogenase accessory protein XdhC [Patescibacteria group bacterium]
MNGNHEWLPVLAELTTQGEPCVLITVMEAKGSTPREAGVKMIATMTAQFGTIGGGNLEFQALAAARELLVAAGAPTVKDYPLGPKLAQCCGGAVTVFLEPFLPASKTLLLFGAGHVGKEVVKVLDGLPVRIKWIDSRAGEFPASMPANCTRVVAANPVGELAAVDDKTYIAVLTHSHDLDFEIVRAAYHKSFAYLGLIGSDTKRARFEKRLAADGVSPEQLQLLHCPIGLGETGKHPREIAISIAAELLTLGLCRGAENRAEAG